MFSINVTSNIAAWSKDFDRKYVKQMPFTVAKALTQTAKDVQVVETRKLGEVFDRPTPFTMRAIGITPARKTDLTAKVFLKDIQGAYLKLQVDGGTRYPKNRALVLPTDLPTNQYGNIPKGQIKRLLRRPDVFSGTVRGIAGIWQRTGRGLLLLVSYEPKATYRKRFPFYGIARRVIAARLRTNIEAAWRAAIATSR
jgi:hypothetical protein